MNSLLHRLLTNHFLRSSAIYSAVSFGASLLQYIFALIVARKLQLSEYGEYMTSLSYLSLLGVPLGAINMMLTQKISQSAVEHRPQRTRQLLEMLQALAISHLGLLIVTLSSISVILFYVSNLWLSSILFVLVFSLISLVTVIYTSLFQGYKLFWAAGGLLFLSVLIKLSAGGILLFILPNLMYLYLIISLSQVVTLIYGGWVVNTHHLIGSHTSRPTTPLKVRAYLQKRGVYLPLLVTLGLVGLSAIDMVVVKILLSPDETGLYAGLTLLGKIITYVTGPLSLVAYAYFTGSDTKQKSPKILLVTSLAIAAIGIGSALFYTLFPHFVITLILGPRFMVIQPVVWLAGLYGASYSLVFLHTYYWLAQENHHSLFVLLGMGLQGLAIWLYHHDFLAVMMATTLVYLLLLGYYLFQLRHIIWHTPRSLPPSSV
ncbi:MAG TPA: hypothetical protein VD999_05380 [Vitreimonas sp.]|nr:hypothetical protein [Vitreimonas sp.]